MGPAKRSATYEDLLAVPDHLVAEIVAGTLHTSPRPASPHAHAASTLGMDIGTPFHRGRGGPGGWWILHEPELHLGADVLVPDRAGWRFVLELEAAARVPRQCREMISPIGPVLLGRTRVAAEVNLWQHRRGSQALCSLKRGERGIGANVQSQVAGARTTLRRPARPSSAARHRPIS